MRDTSIDVYRVQVRVWQSKSFQERMRLGSSADKLALDAAARIAREKYPGDPAGLFLLIHGGSYEPEDRERIANAIRKHFAAFSNP